MYSFKGKFLLTIEALYLISKHIGGVAQTVRACGSYPQCPGFNSLHRHYFVYCLNLNSSR
jgi:hypothetical protein